MSWCISYMTYSLKGQWNKHLNSSFSYQIWNPLKFKGWPLAERVHSEYLWLLKHSRPRKTTIPLLYSTRKHRHGANTNSVKRWVPRPRRQNDTVDGRNTTPVVIYKYMLCNSGNHGMYTLSTGVARRNLNYQTWNALAGVTSLTGWPKHQTHKGSGK